MYFYEKYNQVKTCYRAYAKYYDDINKDPDCEYNHVEPDSTMYPMLSDYERETIQRMAFVGLGRAFGEDL